MASSHTLDMIERFICFDTTSRNSNLSLIEFARAHLDGKGARTSLTFDATGTKANLLASLGPADRPGIILSGHSDTVPVDGQAWSSDPFCLGSRDGRLYGRGVCDMKGFLAIATAMMPQLVEQHGVPIHLAMSYDEEVGCLGVHALIDDIGGRLPQPLLCIVGEPTKMGAVYAHKGKIGGHVSARGFSAHSSLQHQGVNAVEAVAEAIAFLKTWQRRYRDEGPFNAGFTAPNHTTIQSCMVSGGIAVNVIPASASFDFDIRYLPGESAEDIVQSLETYLRDELEPEMQATQPGTGFSLERIPGCAAFWQDPDSEPANRVRGLAPDPSFQAVPFGTEAGYFKDAGIDTMLCGPGSIDQAHKPDEFIELDQVSECERFLSRLAASYSN